MSVQAVEDWLAENYDERSAEYEQRVESPADDDDPRSVGWQCSLVQEFFYGEPQRQFRDAPFGFLTWVGFGDTPDEAAAQALGLIEEWRVESRGGVV